MIIKILTKYSGLYIRIEGIIEGRLEGKLQKAYDIAGEMKKEGLSPAQIIKFTGLSEEAVEKIIVN